MTRHPVWDTTMTLVFAGLALFAPASWIQAVAVIVLAAEAIVYRIGHTTAAQLLTHYWYTSDGRYGVKLTSKADAGLGGE